MGDQLLMGWTCPKCTLENSASVTTCQACEYQKENTTEMAFSREDEEKMAGHAAEALSSLFNTSRPAHAGSGIMSGLGNVVKGAGAGVATLVAAPVLGAQAGGIKGFFKGLGAGVVGCVGLTAAGATTGLAQAARGAMNTPSAMAGATSGKEWSEEQGKYILYNLFEEAGRVLEMSEEDFVEKLRKKKNQGADSGPEAGAGTERENVEVTAPNPNVGTNGKVVKSMELYNLLDIPANASTDKIKRAYYIKAKRCHPDKNPDDPEANTKFRQIGEAYQLLSDPELRAKYDESGKDAVESPDIDPTAMFTMLFGSDAFEPIVGQLKIASVINLQEDYEPNVTTKLQAFKQTQREVRCAMWLVDRIALHVDGAEDRFDATNNELAQDLAAASFGGPMLSTVAHVYEECAKKFLGDAVTSAATGIRLKYRSYENQFKAMHSGYKVFKEVSRMQKQSGEEPAADSIDSAQSIRLMEAMMVAVWQQNVIDIEKTLTKVCHKVLHDHSVDKPTRRKRAQAIIALAKIFKKYSASEQSAIESLRQQMNGHQPEMEVDTETPISVGVQVRLKDLKTAEYNGQIGVVINEINPQGRFDVVLVQTGKQLSIKPENMEKLKVVESE